MVRHLGNAFESSNSSIISRLGFKIHRLTASAANACGFLLTPKIEDATHKQLAALAHCARGVSAAWLTVNRLNSSICLSDAGF
jgi:hypothetical protein